MNGHSKQMRAANHGQLAPLLFDPSNSLHQVRGWERTNLYARDETEAIPSKGLVGSFGQRTTFVLNKKATLYGPIVVEYTITGGQVDDLHAPAQGNNVGERAAWVDFRGDAMLAEVVVRYGGHILQRFDGDIQHLKQRLYRHQILTEGRDQAQRSGSQFPEQGAGFGRDLDLSLNHIVRVDLTELFWVNFPDEYLTPEGLASEVELEITLRGLDSLVYSSDGLSPFIGVNGVAPAVTAARLLPVTISLPDREKQLRLAQFETQQGHLIKHLDLEQQLNNATNFVVPLAAATTFTVRMQNIRLDVTELIFFATNVRFDGAFAGDRYSSDAANAFQLAGQSPITDGPRNCFEQIASFQLRVNGATIMQAQDDAYNRTIVRARYHPLGQVGDLIYVIPYAAEPENTKDCSGSQNYANLHNVELVMTFPVGSNATNVHVYGVSHNIMQLQKGDIVKSLN